MTPTIQADGPLYVGTPYANTPTTVLHVLAVGVFVLSPLAACAAMAVVAFAAFYGRRGCAPCRASVVAPLAMVVSFVTVASTVAWAAGPDMGLLTLGAATGLVVALRWCMAWRERRWWASYSAAQSAAGGEGQR